MLCYNKIKKLPSDTDVALQVQVLERGVRMAYRLGAYTYGVLHVPVCCSNVVRGQIRPLSPTICLKKISWICKGRLESQIAWQYLPGKVTSRITPNSGLCQVLHKWHLVRITLSIHQSFFLVVARYFCLSIQ